MDYTKTELLTEENIKAGITKNQGIGFTIPYSNQEIEHLLTKVVGVVFEYLNRPKLGSALVYVLKELVMNASKANTKRVYFANYGLDINNPEDYQKGMKNFKAEVFSNFNKYLPLLEENGYYIRIDFKIVNDWVLIQIKNNCAACLAEKEKITDRIRSAARFKTIDEVLSSGLDESEGGGFGIIIGILMLRRLGLTDQVINYIFESNATKVVLKIPVNLLAKEELEIIASEITKELERMPPLPESFNRLNRQLQDPNADFNSVAQIIKTDSVLTTEVLRIANSPLYMLPRKVDDVLVAVKMIDLGGVRNLILSEGVKAVFNSIYKKEKIDEVLKHSYQVALISGHIAKLKKYDFYVEDIYVAAILHDIGKIITSTLNPNLVNKIQNICRQKSIPVTNIEELSTGYNHSNIGMHLAYKWNFPEKFVQTIAYHHIPLEAEDSYQTIVFTVYLGNELYYMFEGKNNFATLNYKVLKYFGLDNEASFNVFCEKIKNYLIKTENKN